MNLLRRNIYNVFILKNKKIKIGYNKVHFFFHTLDEKINSIKENEEAYNFEDTIIRRINKMNNTALVFTCENINKKKINNPYIWELIYNRINEIYHSFSLTEIIVLFHAYCNSISFDIKSMNSLINFLWNILENKINDVEDLSSLLGLYVCAEKTKNLTKREHISNLILQRYITLIEQDKIFHINQIRLSIFLKILCSHNKNIIQLDKKYIMQFSNDISKIIIRNINTLMLCLHFFIKYQIYDEPFIILLKQIQNLLIFKKEINGNVILKYFSFISNLRNPYALQEIKNVLSIIYLSKCENIGAQM
ncbi:hypothetical protein PRSY57_0213400 [Plasmodium reichenowi]|uniref:Uncharacterized protein n=1 Tax=Plasmodium reichenowi TaxID=5854 RepID=A0A151LV63_PLARE|nr:hypothetical protein PRSY57_0213400 [Plasmodium reichenowi]KYO03070.1 hypothetical protein PRSY57_0213400 [Plasmodium reichenowi]